MTASRETYLTAFARTCEQAGRSGFSLNLLTSTPGERVDDDFSVTFGVGGLVALTISNTLYEELRSELDPRMRKILRDRPHGQGQRKIEFYPHAT